MAGFSVGGDAVSISDNRKTGRLDTAGLMGRNRNRVIAVEEDVLLLYMFRRLITNLPYNPSLISQVSFYARRVHQEEFVRRLGMICMAITLVIQVLVFVSPPERSLATSANNVLNGIQTRDDILDAWDQPDSDIGAIYGAFELTREDIAKLPQKPNTTIRSTEADYWSIGRGSLTGYSGIKDEYKRNQLSIQYSGRDTQTTTDDAFIYQRQLKAWDVKSTSNTYAAFKGTVSKTGETFWILKDCGNFTKIGHSTPKEEPQKPKPVPKLEIKKSIQNRPESVKPGDTIRYVISYRNATPDTLAESVFIEDQFDTRIFEIANADTATMSVFNGFYRFDAGGLPYSIEYKSIELTVTLKDQLDSGSTVCNQARIVSTNAAAVTSDPACIGVITPCQFDSAIASNNPNCTAPKVICSVDATDVSLNTKKVQFETKTTSSNQAATTILGYAYRFDDDAQESHSSAAGTHKLAHTYDAGAHSVKTTVRYKTVGSDDTEHEATCATTVHIEDTKNQAVGRAKSVKNITKNTGGDLASSMPVNGGDVLEYTISTTNPDSFPNRSVEVWEYIGDVLDYADLDMDSVTASGGIYDATTNKISWDDREIAGNSSVSHAYRVTVKSPIPTTNRPTAAATTFDCKISNAYGNEVTIDINCPMVKSIETLPNTGPGMSMMYTAIIVTVIGYFYARSRVLARELDIIEAEYTGRRI